jgi:hypothetical protein
MKRLSGEQELFFQLERSKNLAHCTSAVTAQKSAGSSTFDAPDALLFHLHFAPEFRCYEL